jgi:hypothetical protein
MKSKILNMVYTFLINDKIVVFRSCGTGPSWSFKSEARHGQRGPSIAILADAALATPYRRGYLLYGSPGMENRV